MKSLTTILTLPIFAFLLLITSCGQLSNKKQADAPFKSKEESSVFPDPIGYINDFEEILSEQELIELTEIIKEHESRTTDQIAIVTVASIAPYEDIDSYSLDLANHWGVGQEGKNNGVLISIYPDLRKARIENGYGIERRLTDGETQRILEEVMIPEFRQDNYFGGLRAGIDAIIEELSEGECALTLNSIGRMTKVTGEGSTSCLSDTSTLICKYFQIDYPNEKIKDRINQDLEMLAKRHISISANRPEDIDYSRSVEEIADEEFSKMEDYPEDLSFDMVTDMETYGFLSSDLVNNEHLVSFKYVSSHMACMAAHPMWGAGYLNYDLLTGRKLNINTEIDEEFYEELYNLICFELSMEILTESTPEEIQTQKSFTIEDMLTCSVLFSEQGMKVWFSPYEIGAYVHRGTIELPKEAIRPFFKEHSVVLKMWEE